jgi:hypothetical protein
VKLEVKVRVTRGICRACLFTIPVLPKLTDDTALAWTVQYQRRLHTTPADAQCLLNHVSDLIQALARYRTATASSFSRPHGITPNSVLSLENQATLPWGWP